MKIIKAKRVRDMIVFGEIDAGKKETYKVGKLKEEEFFEWLKEKSRITEKLVIYIENKPEVPLVKI